MAAVLVAVTTVPATPAAAMRPTAPDLGGVDRPATTRPARTRRTILVSRERPGASIPRAVLRGVPAAGLSFPSGHAIILFGMVALLGPYLRRRWRLVVLVIAALAAAVRVYLGAHSPLDVTGGAAAGLAVGAVLNLVVGVSQ